MDWSQPPREVRLHSLHPLGSISMCKTHSEREARLRRKLVNNELNPIADIILSIILLCMSPFIYLFALVHDKLMFKFLNKTYIYNVSWEVIF